MMHLGKRKQPQFLSNVLEPWIVPIPCTRRLERLFLSVRPIGGTRLRLHCLSSKDTVYGERLSYRSVLTGSIQGKDSVRKVLAHH